MLRLIGRGFLVAALVFAAAACGYDTTATFNQDGSVTLGMKFLLPKSLMQGGSGATVSGFSASDIASANTKIRAQYPGGKVTVVSEGDETGALITIPFKTEKDAFAFLTQPTKLNPSGATSGSAVNLSNTGGMFTSATHTTSGQSDTYSFKTAPTPMPTTSPADQQLMSPDEISSVFTVTFAVTLPHVITSAPGALFTLDRKTAIWKLSWTKAQTLTATTGSDVGLVANVSPLQDARLVIAVGFTAVAVGFLLGMFLTWRGLLQRAPQRAVQPVAAAPTSAEPPAMQTPTAWPGPPPGAPPPTEI